ncbi:5540_t:CDS:2 [Funneliformis geosporum]|nr:5540_t:CDS:2 [Funneliformis geosporum]
MTFACNLKPAIYSEQPRRIMTTPITRKYALEASMRMFRATATSDVQYQQTSILLTTEDVEPVSKQGPRTLQKRLGANEVAQNIQDLE